MKLFYKSIMFLTLFIFCVGSVCAADTTDLDSSLSGTDLKLVDATDNNIICDEDTNNDLDDGSYCCGAVAFQSALKENNINISLKEAKEAVKPNVNGYTSMQNLIDGARRYNLSAVGVNINAEELKTGYIVHMNIDNNSHWFVIKDVTDKVILDDINDNLILHLDEFKQYYTNKSVIISNSSVSDVNCSMLTVNECKELFGGKYAYSYVKKIHYIPANKNPGYAFQIKVVVPKWGGDFIRVTTKKLTPHMICCNVFYKFTYSTRHHKHLTVNYPCFFNLAMKKGTSFSAKIPAKGIKSLKFTCKVSKFP